MRIEGNRGGSYRESSAAKLDDLSRPWSPWGLATGRVVISEHSRLVFCATLSNPGVSDLKIVIRIGMTDPFASRLQGIHVAPWRKPPGKICST
jgi:hypothetical protein